MRNRANTPLRDENSFINGGSAGVDTSRPIVSNEPKGGIKAKPISISLTEENLKVIDDVIRNESVNGNLRVNRSDVVRAALMGISALDQNEISLLIQSAKMK